MPAHALLSAVSSLKRGAMRPTGHQCTRARTLTAGRRGLVALAGCCALSSGCNADRCPTDASTTQALYGGSAEPKSLPVSGIDLGGIVRVGLGSSAALDFCTGFFVARELVLTAKHCAETSEVVEIGLSGSGPLASGKVVAARAHSELDLLLLHVPSTNPPVSAQPIRVWSGDLDESWVGRTVELAGLGETESAAGGELRFVSEVIVSLDDRSITVDGAGRSGACRGDSGGPLLILGDEGAANAIGVLSAGSSSCRGRDIYVRVDRAIDWINAQVESFSDQASACSG
jgi:hypothetical protein